MQAVSLAVHWPPRSSVGVESVTSAVQDPIAVSTTVLPVHRHRFSDAFRSRGIDLHRPRRRWCYSHAEAEPDSDVRRDSVHPAIIVIESDARTTTTIIVRSTEPTSSPDTDVHVSDPHCRDYGGTGRRETPSQSTVWPAGRVRRRAVGPRGLGSCFYIICEWLVPWEACGSAYLESWFSPFEYTQTWGGRG